VVCPFHIEHAPAKRALGEHEAEAWVAQQHTRE
jgi:hypothetical protein